MQDPKMFRVSCRIHSLIDVLWRVYSKVDIRVKDLLKNLLRYTSNFILHFMPFPVGYVLQKLNLSVTERYRFLDAFFKLYSEGVQLTYSSCHFLPLLLDLSLHVVLEKLAVSLSQFQIGL